MSGNSRGKELTRNTLIITIGRASTQLITFLLLPLYTSILSTEEYGIVDFITELAQLIVPIISLLIDQGAFRLLLNSVSDEERTKVISSGFFTLIASSIIAIALFAAASPFIKYDFKVWTLLIMLFTSFSNLMLQIARGLKQTSNYAVGSFVCSAVTLVLNVVLIAYFRVGAVGMLIAVAVGNLVCCLFLFIKLSIWKFLSIHSVEKNIVKEELKYSLPLIPNQLSLWIMNGSDRVIVTLFLGAAANGIMAVSHKFPGLFMVFYHVFQLAWHETGTVHFNDDDRDEFFSKIIDRVITIFATLCMAVIVALPIVFPWLVNAAYKEAYFNIPIYMIASLLNVMIGLLGVVYVAIQKTAEIAKTTLFAAIINIVVNVVLINIIGLYAASISTLIGYLVTLIYRIVDTKKYLNIKYSLRRLSIIASSIFACILVYYLNNRIVSLVVLPIFVIVACLVNREVIVPLINLAMDRIGKERFENHKKMVITIIFTSTIVALSVIVGIAYIKISGKPLPIQKVLNVTTTNIEPEEILDLKRFQIENITCTGLTYDTKNNSYWVADCGLRKEYDDIEPILYEIDLENKNIISQLNLKHILDSEDNLQGIAYDPKDDAIWMSVGGSIVEVSKEGNTISEIDLGKYAKYESNGLCYDAMDDTIWVLCLSKYILHYNKNGDLVSCFDFNYLDQDHLIRYGDDLLITVGADYTGENNYVCRVSAIDGSIKNIYRIYESYAVEGICINGGRIFIVNDGIYHDAKIKENYISVFDLHDFGEEVIP